MHSSDATLKSLVIRLQGGLEKAKIIPRATVDTNRVWKIVERRQIARQGAVVAAKKTSSKQPIMCSANEP